jgi:hypothetical protein
MKTQYKKSYFTILELILSMGIFVVLLLIVSMIFTTAQESWTESAERVTAFENARIAMELMTRDIQSIYYRDNKIPFWYKSQSGSDAYSNQSLDFVSYIDTAPSGAESNLCEVKYQLWYTTDAASDSVGWLMRSVTGDNSSKWNFYENLTAGLTGSDNAFTANNDSSEPYQKLIPYVTSLTFNCYDDEGFSISGTTDAVVELPFSIELNLSVLDIDTWRKWIELGGTPGNLSGDPASDFRTKYERTFTKTVLLGNRGQYD